MLPKISTFVESYDGETKCMYFLIEDDEILEKCNDIYDKVSGSTKYELDSKPIYNKNILKTNIKSYSDETDFHDRKLSEVGCNYICWSVILTDSGLKKDGSYFKCS